MIQRKDPQPLFQGTDWFTNQETVADAYDILDQLREMCLASGEGDEELTPLSDPYVATFLDLCESLISALLFVEAVLVPKDPAQAFPLRWRMTEARLMVASLAQALLNPPPSMSDLFETSLLQIARLKDTLRAMDS